MKTPRRSGLMRSFLQKTYGLEKYKQSDTVNNKIKGMAKNKSLSANFANH